MEPREVTRRQLLGGLATAGGLGAVVGTGTAAVYTDEALLAGSSIGSGGLDIVVSDSPDASSESADGTLSIDVELSRNSPTDTVDLYVSVPEADGENNPAVPWVRWDCSDAGLTEKLSATLRYGDCSEDCVVADSLRELGDGVSPIHGRGGTDTGSADRCLDPGDSLHLELEVGLEKVAKHDVSLDFEFVGVQCRNSGDYDPFADVDPCDSPSKDHKWGHP